MFRLQNFTRLLLLISLTANVVQAQTAFIGAYTIGGSNPDYATINAAVTDLKNGVVVGPTIFNIRSGIYKEKIILPLPVGVSAANTVTFQAESENPSDVVITSSNTGGFSDRATFQLNTTKFIILQNLTVENTASASAIGIHIASSLEQTAEFNTISNCIVRVDSVSSSYGVVGIMVAPLQLDLLYPAYCSRNLVEKCTVYGGYFGIEVAHYAVQMMGTQNTISHNKSFASYNAGIYTSFCDQTQVIGNYVASRVSESVRSSANGISTYQSYNEVYANNMIAASFQSVDKATGLNIFIAYNPLIYYNSVAVNAGSSQSTTLAIGGGFTDIVVKNNIFANFTGGYTYISDRTESLGASIQTDNNDYYTTGPFLAKLGGVDKGTLADIRTYSKADLGSVVEAPFFFSDFNLHTLNPKLNAKAAPVSVVDDYDGELRNAATPDIGADEFTPSAIDIELESVTTVVPPVIGNSNEVKLLFRNNGTSSLTNSTVSVSYSADGGATWSPPESFTASGMANTHDTESFTFTAKWTITKLQQYTLKARINPPGLAADPNKQNDSTSTELCFTLNGYYTVGSSVMDFETISDAIDMLKCGGVQGHVVFNIQPGIYNGHLSIPAISGTSGDATITFRSSTGNRNEVIISDSIGGILAKHAVVQLGGADYIVLSDLTIVNRAVQDIASGVHVTSNATFNKIMNCLIRVDSTGEDNKNTAGIVCSSYEDFSGGAINAHSNTFSGNEISGSSYGIRINGIDNNRNEEMIVADNTILNARRYGIYSRYTNVRAVEGNHVVFGQHADTAAVGIYIANCDGGFTVSGNYIRRASKYGLRFEKVNGTEEPVVANNMIAGGFSNPNFPCGIVLTETSGLYVYHNSVRMDKSNSAAFSYLLGTTSGNYLQNNIFANPGGGYAFYTTDAGVAISSDYNDLYTSGKFLASWEGTEVATLQEFQNESFTDTHSVSTNPVFLSSSDLHTFNLELDGKALFVSSVWVDYDGQLRDTLAPDIGADEFTIGTDGGVLSFSSPVGNVPINAAVPVQVSVSNYGNVAIGNFGMKLLVNGQVYADEVFNGSIDPNSAAEYTFNKSFSADVPGVYVLKAFTAISGDITSTNDTASLSIEAITVGVAEQKSTGELIWYPNPAADMLYIKNAGRESVAEVYDLYGQLFVKVTLNGSLSDRLDLQNVAPGLYLLKIRDTKKGGISKLFLKL